MNVFSQDIAVCRLFQFRDQISINRMTASQGSFAAHHQSPFFDLVQLPLSPHLRQVLTARKWYTALLCNGVVTFDALELAKRYQISYDLQISPEMPELVRI